ncbi:hypothetical protein MKX03_007957, partial [Papaver bracteatum]
MRARQTLRYGFSTYLSDVDEYKLGSTLHVQETLLKESVNPSWRLSLPYVLTGVIFSFLFGYRLGVMNEPLESISLDLGFNGNSLVEGLVVTTCLGGAFFGSIVSGSITDVVGRHRGFQLKKNFLTICLQLENKKLGRFLVGTCMGVGPYVGLSIAQTVPEWLYLQSLKLIRILHVVLISSIYICLSTVRNFYLSSTILKSAGVPSNKGNICVGFENLYGSIIAMTLMDKLGRMILLLESSFGMAVAMCIQASASSFSASGASPYLSIAGPVQNFPNRLRAKEMSFCLAVHR